MGTVCVQTCGLVMDNYLFSVALDQSKWLLYTMDSSTSEAGHGGTELICIMMTQRCMYKSSYNMHACW